ncbi:hypothetical protein OH77DRAFT_1395782 [Trametes cingulata]|nr:hypothetical protein OH77DRAFT_1395782 [Trametes cingulata]
MLDLSLRLRVDASCIGRSNADNGTKSAPTCQNAQIISSSTISSGDDAVELAMFSCAPLVRTQAQPPTVTNICAETCECANTCLQTGLLSFPPSSGDCSRLADTLTTSLTNGTSPTIDVGPGQMWMASRGTCKFSFFNFGPTTVETCILSIVRFATSSVSSCFGSLIPTSSEALCAANSGLWEVT